MRKPIEYLVTYCACGVSERRLSQARPRTREHPQRLDTLFPPNASAHVGPRQPISRPRPGLCTRQRIQSRRPPSRPLPAALVERWADHGHMSHLAEPDRFAEHVAEFVNSVRCYCRLIAEPFQAKKKAPIPSVTRESEPSSSAVTVGFEPTLAFTPNNISSVAPSAARTRHQPQ